MGGFSMGGERMGGMLYLFLLMPHCGNFGRGVMPDLVVVGAVRGGSMGGTPEVAPQKWSVRVVIVDNHVRFWVSPGLLQVLVIMVKRIYNEK